VLGHIGRNHYFRALLAEFSAAPDGGVLAGSPPAAGGCRFPPVRLTRVLAVLLVIGAVIPAVALAHRRANRAERTAILAAVVKQHQLNKAQASCQVVTISTVNQSYAALTWPTKLSPTCLRVAANGVIIEHRTSRAWRFVAVGSSLRCPIEGVPTRVAHDLGVCPDS